MENTKFLSMHLGTLYKKHGMSISYVSGYVDGYTACNYVCSKHGEFVNLPVYVTGGRKQRNGCPDCSLQNRRTGRRNTKLYGVGVNDWDGNVSISYSEKIPEYRMWKDLLKRVYSDVYQQKSPTYIGVTIDKRWHSLKCFIEDVSKLKNYQKGLHDGYALDKDIAINGNRHYSLETCCFVPPEINTQFRITSKVSDLPIGVYKKDGVNGCKYACDCRSGNKTVYLGLYQTPEEAFEVRKKFKQGVMKELAEKYEDVLDERVLHKLLNYDYNENGLITTPDLTKEI